MGFVSVETDCLKHAVLILCNNNDYFWCSGKRFPSGQNSKFRHHSVDDDYYAYYNGPYNYYNGYGYPEKFGMHYSSQPSLLRSAGQRDSKYQHPHARYSGGQVK